MTPARILIVEDEAIVAQNLRETLVKLGYAVAGMARNGEDALRLARERRPDVVLMDIRLADGLNGVETAERLQGVHRAPVVYVTAFTTDVALEQAIATSPYGFLQKPYTDRGLEATIRMTLERRRLEQAADERSRRLRERNDALERQSVEISAFGDAMLKVIRGPLEDLARLGRRLGADETWRLSEEGRRGFVRIERTAVMLANLFRGLGELAQVAGASLQDGEVDVGRIVEQLLEQRAPRLSGVAMRVSGLPSARGDANLVRRALAILIENALRSASRNAAPSIEIGWSESERAYYVRDNSASFSSADLERMFLPFERIGADEGLTGVEMSLPLVRCIAQRHGGLAWARAEPAGATFYFALAV
jgi:light-regulated signal transduction histidine kinase (bacteriophytochrome)